MADEEVKNGKHYWLTPPELMKQLQEEFGFNFDPCPFPRPEGFNGLYEDWGESNYVNPLFVGYDKGEGITAWSHKAIAEYKKGKKVVIVFPVDKWILRLMQYASEVRNLGDVRWLSTEDGLPGKGVGRHVACFVLDPKKEVKK